MPSPLTNLELIVLGWIADDYGALPTLERNVSEDAGRAITHEELHATLLSLKARGLVEAYRYDETTSAYTACAIAPDVPIESYWWLANLAGTRLLETEPEGP